MKIIIYKAVNKLNNKCYIGQTNRDLSTRIAEHVSSQKTHFHKALMKYGVENFEWSILESHTNREEANRREIELIKKHESYAHGYNSHPGGRVGGYTTERSIQKRQATREANGGYDSVSKRQKENNVSHRPEVQQKISDSVKKLWEDPEYRANQLAKREQANPVVKCPHCEKEGRNAIMQRHHFDRCKFKNK
jgi:group I intron endonuclease